MARDPTPGQFFNVTFDAIVHGVTRKNGDESYTMDCGRTYLPNDTSPACAPATCLWCIVGLRRAP